MKRKGFTLMELVVVIALIAVLGLLLYPKLTNYLDAAELVVCNENRQTVRTDFIATRVFKPTTTLQEIVGEFTDKVCPSNGVISITEDKEHLQCSIHKGEAKDPLDWVDDDRDLVIRAKYTLEEILANVNEKGTGGSFDLIKGQVLTNADGRLFVVNRNGTLGYGGFDCYKTNSCTIDNVITQLKVFTLAKEMNQSIPIVDSSSIYTNGSWITKPVVGQVVFHEGNYYFCNEQIYNTSHPGAFSSSTFIKLTDY